MLELEGGDVGAAHDFVVGVHGPGCAVGLGVADLDGGGWVSKGVEIRSLEGREGRGGRNRIVSVGFRR